MNLSKGHKITVSKHEYFLTNNGLFSAPIENAIGPDGYRIKSRRVCPNYSIEATLNLLGAKR